MDLALIAKERVTVRKFQSKKPILGFVVRDKVANVT
jgi:hypothetical protein